jgi:hypothetical protein
VTGWRKVLIVGLLAGIGLDAHAAVDRSRMQRDIGIMEGVLAELLSGEDQFAVKPTVNGLYFDGYGVLLLVERFPRGTRLRDDRAFGATRGVEEEMADLKERLVEFYAEYAGKLQHLPDSERVTVRIEGVRGSNPFYGAFQRTDEASVEDADLVEDGSEAEEDEDSVPVKHYGFDPARVQAQIEDARKRVQNAIETISPERGGAFPTLVATATKAEVAGDGTGTVKFDAHRLGGGTDRSIRVMAGILGRSRGGLTSGQGEATGFYEPGLGAVYLVKNEPPDDFSAALQSYNTPQGEADSLKSRGTGDEAIVEAHTRQLVDLIGTYGGTLKPVKKEESIVVRMDFGHWGKFKGRPSGLVIQVQMEDVDLYQKGKLDLDGLMVVALVEEI